MSELDQFFEALEDEEEGEGDVADFPDPTGGIIAECYADFQKVTGFAIPLSSFKPWVMKGWTPLYGDPQPDKPGLELVITDTSDPLLAKITNARIRILLDMEMNFDHDKFKYTHRGEDVTAEVEIFLVNHILDKSIPLAKYKRTPEKGLKRTWLRPDLKKKN